MYWLKIRYGRFVPVILGITAVWLGNSLFSQVPQSIDRDSLWNDWQRFRSSIVSPVGAIKATDLERARQNLDRHQWAQDYRDRLVRNVEQQVVRLDKEFLEEMIPETTPGSLGITPCAACHRQGKPFLLHGSWKWDWRKPDQVSCMICKTLYPNSEYEETVELRTEWGRPQLFTYIPDKLNRYRRGQSEGDLRASMSSWIRARKVQFMGDLLSNLGEAWALTGEVRYAQYARQILLRFAEVYPHWLIHNSYGQFMDMDPAVAAQILGENPDVKVATTPGAEELRTFHWRFWHAGRIRGGGMEGLAVLQLASAYDLTRDACDEEGNTIYSEQERFLIERDLSLQAIPANPA